jgi:lipoic acid synthetase
VKKWITMHGISINVEKTSLSNFKGIVPCGLVGREVCCVNEFLHTPMTVDEFASRMIHAMQEIFLIQLHKVDDE